MKFVTFFFLLSLSHQVFAQFSDGCDKKQLLRGDVKTVKTYYITSINGEMELDTCDFALDTFSREGHLLSTFKIKNNNRVQSEEYIYDLENRLSEIKVNVTGIGLIRLTQFSYDTTGNVVQLLMFNKDGKTVQRKRFIYNTGFLVTDLDSMGRTITRTEYRYNKQGKLVEKFVADPQSYAYRLIYKYRTDGKVLSETRTSNSDEVTSYEYDQYDNITNESLSNMEGEVFAEYPVLYQYDIHGNWTKRIERDRHHGEDFAVVRYITVREFDYY